MRILYIHQHFCTPAGYGGTRSYEFARRWVQKGHSVEIICGVGYDPTLRPNGVKTVDGIQVRVLGSAYRPSMGFLSHLWSFLVFAMKSVVIAATTNADVVLATSTPLTIALPALAAKWIARRPVVFEVRDVWPDAAVDAGALRNPILIAAARLLEMFTYHAVDHIVPLSTGMEDRIARKGVSRAKMTMLSNCCDLDHFRPDIDGSKLRREYDAEGKFIVLYMGAIGITNDVDCLVQIVRWLKEEDKVEFWIVGNGNRFEYLKKKVDAMGAEGVRLFGLRPKKELPRFTAAADVGLVTFLAAPVYYENSPNKFFDYIAAGLPVVFNRDTWLGPHLDKYKNGWCCDPDRPKDVVGRLLELRDNSTLRQEMGRNSRRLAEDCFSRDRIATQYIRLLSRHGDGAVRTRSHSSTDPGYAMVVVGDI